MGRASRSAPTKGNNHTNTIDTLTAAKALIADPQRWTKNSYARDISGYSVLSGSKEAVCWCAQGAIFKVAADDHESIMHISSTLAGDALRTITPDLYLFNDAHTTTHTEIMDLYDRAIANLSKQKHIP